MISICSIVCSFQYTTTTAPHNTARINIRSFVTSIVFSTPSCYSCTVPFDAKVLTGGSPTCTGTAPKAVSTRKNLMYLSQSSWERRTRALPAPRAPGPHQSRPNKGNICFVPGGGPGGGGLLPPPHKGTQGAQPARARSHE